jgi:hypothetical protein
MALPVMAVPTFKTKVPSTGKQIEYRPFLMKEEKILLMAMEGGDAAEMAAAMKRTLESCIMTEIDIESLATFDLEYLFLQLRGKSVGEVIEISVGHTGETECQHRTEVKINIDDIKVSGVKKDKTISITDEIGVKVRYPSMNDALKLDSDDGDAPLKLIASCIDVVYDKENVYDEFTEDEMIEWLERLNKKQFDSVVKFFENIPKLSYKVEWTCPECKQKDSFVLEGMADFFILH